LDKEYYIRIIGENRNLIYKVCYSFCTDPEDRKDLEQEILINIWKGVGRFNGQVKISTWIYKIALNTAISYYRKEKKKGIRISIDRTVISLSDTDPPDADYQQAIARLYQFISELQELDKAVILLYLDDIKYSEISSIIGITESNVATKINRIKKKLKDKFEQSKLK